MVRLRHPKIRILSESKNEPERLKSATRLMIEERKKLKFLNTFTGKCLKNPIAEEYSIPMVTINTFSN